jgi:hypothetical protein
MSFLIDSINTDNIKKSVIVLGLENKHQPSEFWIPETLIKRFLSFAIYIVFWFFILYGMKAIETGHNTSIKIGFTIGFLLLILYDYLFNYAISLAIDQNTNRFVKYNPFSQNILLDNKVFKLGETKGLVMKKNAFDKLVKEKHIKSATVQEFRDNEYVKTLGGDNQESPMTSYNYVNSLVIAGSYMFIILITSCILASHHNKKLLSAMFPFATTAGVLCVAIIALWFIDRNYTGLVGTEKIKSRIYITGFSFALTGILTPFLMDI